MIQANADIVPGDSGGPLASPGGVIGMDTAGNDAGDQQGRPPGSRSRSTRRCRSPGRSPPATPAPPSPSATRLSLGSSSAPDRAAARRTRHSSRTAAERRLRRGSPGVLHQQRRPDRAVGHRAGPLRHPDRRDDLREPRGPAGMTGGAVITAVNGQAVGSPDELASIMTRFHPGDTISVTWVSPSGSAPPAACT